MGTPQKTDGENVTQMAAWKETKRADDRVAKQPPLSGGGGGGTFDGMERVVKLETLMDVVRTDVGALKTDVRDVRDRLIRLEEKVAHLPSKGFIVTATSVTLALITALTLFQSKIQALLNISP